MASQKNADGSVNYFVHASKQTAAQAADKAKATLPSLPNQQQAQVSNKAGH